MTSTTRPPLQRIVEFGIYVGDVRRSVDFYERVFGFPVLLKNERIGALDVEGHQVLLLFKLGASAEAIETEWGVLPGHDGEGTTHFAFAIRAEDLCPWEDWLAEQDVETESKVTCGVDPVWWTPDLFGERSLSWRERDHRTRRSFGIS